MSPTRCRRPRLAAPTPPSIARRSSSTAVRRPASSISLRMSARPADSGFLARVAGSPRPCNARMDRRHGAVHCDTTPASYVDRAAYRGNTALSQRDVRGLSTHCDGAVFYDEVSSTLQRLSFNSLPRGCAARCGDHSGNTRPLWRTVGRYSRNDRVMYGTATACRDRGRASCRSREGWCRTSEPYRVGHRPLCGTERPQ